MSKSVRLREQVGHHSKWRSQVACAREQRLTACAAFGIMVCMLKDMACVVV